MAVTIVKTPGVVTVPPKVQLVTDGSIEGTSFRRVQRVVKRRLIVSVQGMPKQGKTHFSCTAPGPIAFLNFDMGDEGVVDAKFPEKDIHIADYRVAFPYEQPKADAAYKQFVNDYKAALGSDMRSVIIDTAVELWELERLAKLGKLSNVMPLQYGPVNKEYQELIRKAYDSDTNLILIHKLRKRYVNDQWDGSWERGGFHDTGYLVQASVECYKEDGIWKLKVLESRQNPKADGVVIENPTFAKLGMLIFPDSKEEDWQ